MRAMLTALAAVLWLGAAQAQPQDPISLSGLVGREVRSPERDRVIGSVEDVQPRENGGGKATIWLEETGRMVTIDLSRLERQGGKLYLPMADGELAGLPDAEAGSADRGEALPYGGLTPGWGVPQGQAGQGR